MHLRSIALSGFKTFARRTEIVFDAGVTAIVGPNGSGKSNSVDAFKWVLGESQARDLRGRRMEEVIYAGGEHRGRAAAAEVTVVIDNADHRIPVDFVEVAIRRRVDRSGSSEYFLNETRIRRRELMELLSSTGLTTDGYAIVDQRDIESIITSGAEQRRQLIEEAARVRGVKAKRAEAAERLRELAQNLIRLEDIKSEIEPRRAQLGAQAEAAAAAAAAASRLEALRGSIVYEQWRVARDDHRRLQSQIAGAERRLAQAAAQASEAESAHAAARAALDAAQDRRLERESRIGGRRLELAAAEHAVALSSERLRTHAALALAATTEGRELAARLHSDQARMVELEGELRAAREAAASLPEPPSPPSAVDLGQARQTRVAAEAAQRAHRQALDRIASLSAREHYLKESIAALELQLQEAERALPDAEARWSGAQSLARAAAAATEELTRAGAELEALRSLLPEADGGLRRLGEVVTAQPGYEAALSSALGPLVEARVAREETEAEAAIDLEAEQVSVLFPLDSGPVATDSLWHHVDCEAGYEGLARSLLGGIVIGRDVTLSGVYRAPGLRRGGRDQRVRMAARRRWLRDEVARLTPLAAPRMGAEEDLRDLELQLGRWRALVERRPRLREMELELDRVQTELAAEQGRMPSLEAERDRLQVASSELERQRAEFEAQMERQRLEARRLEQERAAWSQREQNAGRRLRTLERELEDLASAVQARELKAASARLEHAAQEEAQPALMAALETARAALKEAEEEAPEGEAELALAARDLLLAEEARVAGKLSQSSLQAALDGLLSQSAALLERMQAMRATMPQGLAPEELPGGKAREREMRQLERQLEEIGPINALAESEFRELEERYRVLDEQLEDIVRARADLESLIERLRGEEEERYEAVFTSVAAGFMDFFRELSGGGTASLTHTPGADGPRSGVEILVRPPNKRLQNITLLSSGERSLTALALVLALEAVNPAPFIILDEVDAALDDANVGRFRQMLQRLGQERQLLVITHNHTTMAAASALYGVHLDESGSSHLVSVRLEDGFEGQPAQSRSA